MSRFNTATSVATKTTNLAGGKAFVETPELELVSLLLTSFMKDQYYRSADDSITRIGELIKVVDPLFAAKAALYARNEFGMRSVSHVVAGEVAGNVHGVEWTKRFFDKIVRRPDDMSEILSYYQAHYKKTEPNALKKGFAAAFSRFDEYQLAKYKAEGKDISLIDLANLVHPKNTPAIKALINGTLKTPETWETKLSEAGKSDSAEDEKALAWGTLLSTKKLGYMALLKNLRNILEQAPEAVEMACEQLQDEKKIRASLVLPFRFTTAYEELQKINTDGVRKILVALSKALDIATKNVPVFEGKTLVVLDTSSSMNGQPAKIGALLSAILVKSNNEADFMTFDSTARYHTLNPLDSTLTIAQSIPFHGGSTNFGYMFDEANKAYDRIIILSDMQAWGGYYTPLEDYHKYVNRVGKRPKIYSFDLQGYGTLQFPHPEIYAIAGFSEKIFDVMKVLEQDKQALINTIKAVEL